MAKEVLENYTFNTTDYEIPHEYQCFFNCILTSPHGELTETTQRELLKYMPYKFIARMAFRSRKDRRQFLRFCLRGPLHASDGDKALGRKALSTVFELGLSEFVSYVPCIGLHATLVAFSDAIDSVNVLVPSLIKKLVDELLKLIAHEWPGQWDESYRGFCCAKLVLALLERQNIPGNVVTEFLAIALESDARDQLLEVVMREKENNNRTKYDFFCSYLKV